jgi:hypothetical protein
MIQRLTVGVVLMSLALLVGCGGVGPPPKSAAVGGAQADNPGGKDAGAKGDIDAAAKAASAPVERKIIYTATIDVIVKDLDEVLPQVVKLVAAQKG